MTVSESTESARHRALFLKKEFFHKNDQSRGKEDDSTDFIQFKLKEEHYALELRCLQEILKVKAMTRIPGSAKYLKGVINLRGEIITVLDLNQKLGRGSSLIGPNSRILVIRCETCAWGILADEVREIIRLKQSHLLNPPASMPEEKRRFVKQIGQTQDGIIILLDLRQIVSSRVGAGEGSQ